jgi:hypothetical protein
MLENCEKQQECTNSNKIRANFLTHSISHYSECRHQWSCAMYIPDRKGWNENCGNLLTKIFKMFLRPENCMIIVQLQARNLSEFFSVQEKEASSNKFSSLEGGLYRSSTNPMLSKFANFICFTNPAMNSNKTKWWRSKGQSIRIIPKRFY